MTTRDVPITALRLALSGTEISLGPGEHVLGRGAECAVLIEDPLASRRHAAITVAADGVTLRDLGSRNGVLVNGEDASDGHVLCDGDLVTIGSQALVVLQVCRGNRAREEPPAPHPAGHAKRHAMPPPPAHKPAPLGRIAVRKRALETTVYADTLAGSTTTTLNQGIPLTRPASALRTIAEAAGRAIATNRASKAEKILEGPLQEVLATLRVGIEVESEIVDIAVQQALALVEITGQTRWEDYVRALYDQMRIPMPPPVADRLARAMRKKR